MFEQINGWLGKYRDGVELANGLFEKYKDRFTSGTKINRVVFVGMGSSGNAGRVADTFMYKFGTVPSFFIDSWELPGTLLASDTLAFVVSFSGDTWETETALQSLADKFVPTIVLTRGGKIGSLAEAKNIPTLILPEAPVARAAFPTMFGSLLRLLELFGLISKEGLSRIVESHIEVHLPRFAKDSAIFNSFLDAASGVDMVHVWGVRGDALSAAYRFASQLSENAKMQSVTSSIPALTHNLIEGFEKFSSTPLVVIMYTDFLPARLDLLVSAISEACKAKGVALYKPEVMGETWEAQFTHFLLWSDFASYYLSKARNVDAMSTPMMDEIKKKVKSAKIHGIE